MMTNCDLYCLANRKRTRKTRGLKGDSLSSVGLAAKGVIEADYTKTVGLERIQGDNGQSTYQADSPRSFGLRLASVWRVGGRTALDKRINGWLIRIKRRRLCLN